MMFWSFLASSYVRWSPYAVINILTFVICNRRKVQRVTHSGALITLIEFIILEVVSRFVEKKCHFDDVLEFF